MSFQSTYFISIFECFWSHFVSIRFYPLSDSSNPGENQRPVLTAKKLKSTLYGGASLENLDKENSLKNVAHNVHSTSSPAKSKASAELIGESDLSCLKGLLVAG